MVKILPYSWGKEEETEGDNAQKGVEGVRDEKERKVGRRAMEKKRVFIFGAKDVV